MGQGSGGAMSCGVGHRHDLDLALLWHGAAAAALIPPRAWEPQYAVGVALKREKKKTTRIGIAGVGGYSWGLPERVLVFT